LSLVTVGDPPAADDRVSLYLDLWPGKKPDLEVVARAALAYVEAIRETGYILNPGMDVSVEFVSGTEGSLSLNTILKSIKPDPVALKAIALIVLGWFASDLRTYGVIKFLDTYLPTEQRRALTDEDIKRITQALKDSLEGKVAKVPVNKVYRELERDPAIKGVGATRIAGQRPGNIVPRERFPELSQTALIPDSAPKKRRKPSKERLTLIGPWLAPREHQWRFYTPQIGEFSASIADQKFINGILTGRRKIQMRAGIQLNVIMETREEMVDNVWVVKERVITSVMRVGRLPKSADLFAFSEKNKTNDDEE
jgi:hypothetical protein